MYAVFFYGNAYAIFIFFNINLYVFITLQKEGNVVLIYQI